MKVYSLLASLLCAFILSLTLPAGALSWTEFPSDPIYTPYPSFPASSLPDDYFPSVIFSQTYFDNHGAKVSYKMWHQGAPNGIALSYSNDGIHWSLQGIVITDVNALHPTVIYDPSGFGGGPYYYKMWYWTGTVGFSAPNLAIKFSESKDGVTWTTPVATTQPTTATGDFLADDSQGGSYFYQFYGFGTVMFNAAATSIAGQPFTFPYVAFFDSSAAGIAPQITEEAVGLAYSDDGIFWTRFGFAPVLIPSGNILDWDGLYAYRASVIKLSGIYQMFYSGSNDTVDPFGYAHGIGHATSSDGINWTKDPTNPIFAITDPAETWRSGRTFAPSVVVGDSLCLQMWFSGGQNSGDHFSTAAIGYAMGQCKVGPAYYDAYKVSYFDVATAFTPSNGTYGGPGNSGGAGDALLRIVDAGNWEGGNVGDVCGNIYVYNDTQEQMECCSCPLSANALLSLSVINSLTSNPFNPKKSLSAGVINIVGSSGACSNSPTATTAAGPYTIAGGLHEWINHTEKMFSTVGALTQSTPVDKFSNAVLDPGELANLQGGCAAINGANLHASEAIGICSCGKGD